MSIWLYSNYRDILIYRGFAYWDRIDIKILISLQLTECDKYGDCYVTITILTLQDYSDIVIIQFMGVVYFMNRQFYV